MSTSMLGVSSWSKGAYRVDAVFTLVRHGVSAAEDAGVILGRDGLNDPLITRGREQIVACAEKLDAVVQRGATILSSPYRRAVESATILARRLTTTNVVIEPLLEQVDFGSWVGRPARALGKGYRELVAGDDISFPGGESSASVAARCLQILETVASSSAGQTTVLVTHGIVIQSTICSIVGYPYARAWLDGFGHCRHGDFSTVAGAVGTWHVSKAL